MMDPKNGEGEAPSPNAAHQSPVGSTRNQEDAQSNAATASNAADGPAPSKPASKASSTRNSTPATTSMDIRSSAQTSNDASTALDAMLDVQDAVNASPNLAQSSSKDSEENGAAPYGTRSRNRPGRSRPNYAEDTEMDFEMTAASTNGNTSEPPSRDSAATENGQSSGVSGKRGSGPAQGNASWGNSGPNPKDNNPAAANISGASSVTATNTPSTAQPTTSKRRKNAASTNGTHHAAAAPSQPGPKRGNQIMVAAHSARETNMLTFEISGAMLKNGHMEADDGQTVSINDQVYLVCEPPGEPYYLCRVMEFIHVNNDPKQRVESMRVNWFYRPRDVQRYNNDSRLVYATMHSDLCPITSLRGKCQILHRSEIGDLDDYRKTKDSFWFNQVFDRFIHRWYDVIPTSQVINVPDKVKKALDERWKYICLETSRVKELTSAVKSCKRCVGFCASNDSVECAVCHNTYHMNCVRPPLLKKPSRGFAWACGPCSRAQEKKLEARRTPLLGAVGEEGDEEEMLDEEEEEASGDTNATTPDPDGHVDVHPGTQAEIALAKMWPMRYLGIHARVEDALQYDDRAIYPRASSRLGPRHQANVNVWHGRPVELVKPAEIKKRYVKAAGNKKEGKLSKETVAAIEADKAEKAKRPKWVMDEPPGYVRRGEDLPNKDSKCSAELMFKMPPLGVHSTRGEDNPPTVTEDQVKAYMERAKALAKQHVGVEPHNTNFLDKCLALFTKHQYDAEAALKQVKKLDKRKDLKEPELSKEEEKKWSEGVAKYGSEIRSVRLHTSKNMFYGDAVRYYYIWKKTPKGREIWGAYSNRKGRSKRVEPDAQARLLDDVADNQDDSAFDNDKAIQRKRNFQCKFCNNRHSRQWRRAPGVSPGQMLPADGRSKDRSGFLIALCLRCANLWRKYAVKWENVDEIAKKVAQGGGKAWKRRIDEELLREVYAAQTDPSSMSGTPEYVDAPAAAAQALVEPPKKKQKTGLIANGDSGTSTPVNEIANKKKEKEKAPPVPKAPTPPPVPAPPRLKILPCAVCRSTEGSRLECAACRLTVHKSCYGIDDPRHVNKWYCDTCKNDKKESVSYTYECVLCPYQDTNLDFYEQPKISHKKKTDRDREKERLEKELVDRAKEDYRLRQLDKGRPLTPREPLKRTADNNWVHVYCALWHPEIKFSNATRFDMVEGIGAPTLRYDAVCKLCKTTDGACASCLHCHATFHVGCAHGSGYVFGFDMTPVKASRRDAVPTVTLNGDTGSMVAAIWCKEHAPKSLPHPMNEEVEGTDTIALQLFAREFKQADLTLTGTARKANLVDQSTRIVPQQAPTQANRRASAITTQTPTSTRGRPSNAGLPVKEESSEPAPKSERKCVRCQVEASPRWWKAEGPAPVPSSAPRVVDGPVATNGAETNGVVAIDQKPVVANGQIVAGSVDHTMTDAPPVALAAPQGPLTIDIEAATVPLVSYLCQKCHWKRQNGAEEEEERERSLSVHPEAQQLPLRSPAVQAFVPPPPPAMAGSWAVPSMQPSMPNQPPPLPSWHNGVPPPAPGHPPHHMHNGIVHPPPQHAIPVSHPPPFHAPYPPSNGYPPYSGPPMHSQMPPAPLRGPYPPVSGPPPPLHLTNGSMLVNGMHSPHPMPYSPTHPHGHHSSRSTESPYTGPPQGMSQYTTVHHGSPAPGRPATPRDTVMRDAPAVTSAPTERANTGASASPSLRNLLH